MNDPQTVPKQSNQALQQYRISVLLIDDQPMIAEAVRRALNNDTDIDLHYCQQPNKALEIAAEIQPTVILQDLVMPELNGLTMVRFFRTNSETAQIPIIVLSTKEEPEIKSKAFGLGANDYLVKLPDKIELIARIRYHSKSYINQKERDAAFRALQESEKRLAEANRILEKLSALDGLTGIANRRRFDQELKSNWHRAIRQSTSLSLIMIDIDFFKLFNDHYGHQHGDECLKQVARALEKTVTRQTDLVARYGGEEFAAILPETGLKGAVEVAENMRANVEKLLLEHKASKVSDIVSISVGVATAIPEQNSLPEALVAAADQGLYLAKESGRNQVKFSKIIAG